MMSWARPLASQTFAIDANLENLETNPVEASHLLRALKAQDQETVAEIRQLVYELRPPTLDELGLIVFYRHRWSN